jgi:hypothetical protein
MLKPSMRLPLLPSQAPAYVNERKFAGPVHARTRVAALLDARCLPDREHPAGRINSVYFDTPDLRAKAEKDNGDNLKRKVRARWYGPPERLRGDVPVFLELKCRIGSARRKVRVETRVSAGFLRSAPLSDPAWPELFAANAAALGDAVGPAWAPVCRIEYDRVRYNDLEGGSRVSVDWRIRAVPNEDVFPWSPPVALGALVCEFKNRGGDPPRWAEALHRAGLRLRSFSKYGECMRRMSSGIP